MAQATHRRTSRWRSRGIQDLSVNADGYKATCRRDPEAGWYKSTVKKPCHRASGFPFTTHWGSRRDVGTCAMARSARYARAPRAPLNACNATRRQQSAHTPARRPEHVHVCMEFVSAYCRTRACHHCDGHRRDRHERRLSSLCMQTRCSHARHQPQLHCQCCVQALHMLCHMHVNEAQVASLSDRAAATRVVVTARASIGQVTARNSTRLLWHLSVLAVMRAY